MAPTDAPFAGHPAPIVAVATTPNGRIITAGGFTARVWNPDGTVRRILPGHTGGIWAVAATPDGHIISGGNDGTIRVWDPNKGVQIGGTPTNAFSGQLVIRPHAHPLSDRASRIDSLGFQPEADALARVLAARATSTPLAVALLADWGAGKSSIMVQAQEMITRLAEGARNGINADAFLPGIHHVQFNAWHYSDDSVLLGMAHQMLTTLSPSAQQPEATEEQRAQARRRHEASEHEVRRLQRIKDATAPTTQSPWSLKRWAHTARHGLGVAFAPGRRGITIALLILVAMVVIAVVVWAAQPPWASRLVAFVKNVRAFAIAAIAAAGGAAVLLRKVLRGFRDALVGMRKTTHEACTAELADKEKERDLAEADLKAKDALARLDGLLRSPDRVARRAERRGGVGLVQDQLDELAQALNAAFRQRSQPSGATRTTPGRTTDPEKHLDIDRIILWVDDLDRCAPERVVDALQAVSLLQSTNDGENLFATVVGVDARWLRRSLAHHDAKTFVALTRTGDKVHEHMFGRVGDPLDYLDKFFQIPMSLPAPTTDARRDYLIKLATDAGIMAQPETEQTSFGGSQSNSGATPARTPQPTPDVDDPVDESGTSNASSTKGDSKSDRPDPDKQPDQSAETTTRAVVQPRTLVLTEKEAAYLPVLTAAQTTPRAIKKFLNLYQLVRLGTTPLHADFTGPGEAFRVTGLLLALIVGQPAPAARLFTVIEGADDDEELLDLVTRAATDTRPTADHQPHARDTPWGLIRETVRLAVEQHGAPAKAEPYQPWVREIARFSFHTEDLWPLHGTNPPSEPLAPPRTLSHEARTNAKLVRARRNSYQFPRNW